MSEVKPGRSHAVVCGSGMMGLCVAEVLSRHFQQVTVIDRDVLPVEGAPGRRGVPQSLQPHGVQYRGRLELEALFPGLLQSLRDQGAVEFDGSEVARFGVTGWLPRYPHMGLTMLSCTRPLLETNMRRLLRQRRSNLRWVEGTRVTAFKHTSDTSVRVTGVETDCADESLRDIDADLVVDCTGRGSRVLPWIEKLGLPRPTEWKVESFTNYATRFYRAPAEASNWWWRTILIDSTPPDMRRSCVLTCAEGGMWVVTAIGVNKDYAPTDEQGWHDFVAGVRSPVIAQVLQKAEPLSDVMQNRTTACIWRRMHEYRERLDGLLLAGDNLCTFNPNYGQGITGAALAATALDSALSSTSGPVDHRVAQRYYSEAARWQKEGWDYSVAMDLRWPGTDGERPPLFALQNWAAGVLERVAQHDVEMVKVIARFFDFGANRWAVASPGFLMRFAVGLTRYLVARPRLPGPLELDPFELPLSALPSGSEG